MENFASAVSLHPQVFRGPPADLEIPADLSPPTELPTVRAPLSCVIA